MQLYILEDEIRVLHYLLGILQKIPYINVTGHSSGIAKAVLEIPQLKPDVILADIHLKDGDIFQLFNEINIENIQVIFLTAYDQYAIRALNLGAIGYLLKPIDEEELIMVLEKCDYNKKQEYVNKQQLEISRNYFQNNSIGGKHRIALKGVDYIEVIPVEEILYCKSDKGYTTFYLVNGNKIIVSKCLKEYENILMPLGLFRCHQSYIVNLIYITKYYKEGFLQLKKDIQIPVSSRKKDQVISYLLNNI